MHPATVDLAEAHLRTVDLGWTQEQLQQHSSSVREKLVWLLHAPEAAWTPERLAGLAPVRLTLAVFECKRFVNIYCVKCFSGWSLYAGC